MRRRAVRVMSDRVVLAGIALLIAFVAGFAAYSIADAGRRAHDDRALQIAIDQVDLTRRMSDIAEKVRAGDELAVADLAGAATMLERGHFGLRYGDAALGLHGLRERDLEMLLSESETALGGVTTAARSLIGGDTSSAADLTAHATVYERSMTSVANRLATDALNHSVRSQQVQLGAVAAGFVMMIVLLMVAAARSERIGVAAKRPPESREIDHLTGLVRRKFFIEQLTAALTHQRPGGGFVAVMLIGLAPRIGMKTELPASVRDRAIQEAARRIRAAVRSSDLVGRIGRDGVAVLIDGTPRVDDAGRVAVKLQRALHAPAVVDGMVVNVDLTIGIALAPLDASSADDLVEKAALARRAATGPSGYRYYSSDLRPAYGSREQLVADLRNALDAEGELWIAYQPKVRVSDGDIVGYEALIRWDHPTLGPIEPADFIPIAEESDVIVELGRWVIDEVCRQQSEWRRTQRWDRPVSINVSSRQFRQGDLTADVTLSLDRHGIDPDAIEIELTEGVLLDGHDHPVAHMERLQAMGVRIAVDDFGTGYSSLSYLKRFPIDTLKIDRSFIRELSEGNEDAAISTAIIGMAHSLDLEVVAEGVETGEQFAVLQTLGCDTAQGFFFARPVAARELPTTLGQISATR